MHESTDQVLAEDEYLLHNSEDRTGRCTRTACRWPLIAMLLASNLVFALGWGATLLHLANGSEHRADAIVLHPPSGLNAAQVIAQMPELPKRPVQLHWYTAYSSPNDTETDILWNNISTAHGHIAVNHNTATAQDWLPSMPVPGSEDKGLYLLESYHQLHCLKIVRKLFFESQAGIPLSYPVQHVRHCFDAFRQFIMCHADNTPLYTLGKHTSGDGQWHMCNDWNALRDYATERSACFRDRSGKETLREQFGNCDDGLDGLLVDAPALDLSDVVPV
ncbi:Putative mycotoxin biosynthesis protein UstYa [Septoria linicola]|uniref:Mycotoxin biosynthesis protein UstYa n=1 Tax=Septoria linicola TaxID=215465 RepID=A0A9Q9B005_9PEZI|nr:putative mycotoxin biosynthesis protein UstYa [Septoria linicola]USW54987.1 Putative mycotoxin biosynthesis protein UstYa [Septoria linicola]